MKTRFISILIVIISNFSFAQTKEEIISKITKLNYLDTWKPFETPTLDNNGLSNESNYYNFEKLKEIISTQDLLELSHHKNEVLKLYSIKELINQNNPSIDILQLILDEIPKKKYVKTIYHHLGNEEFTYDVIYGNYISYVASKIRRPENENYFQFTSKLINHDKLLLKINSELLKIDQDLYWSTYSSIFSVKNYDENTKQNIIKLLYKYNNFFAFEYLKENDSKKFQEIHRRYLDNYFIKAKFDNTNQVQYLLNFAKFAFENNDKKMQKKILEKLKTTDDWKMLIGAFKYQIFDKYNVKL